MIDAALVLYSDSGPTAFGARADIFHKRAFASALRWLKIVPLARQRDGLAEVAKNYEIFDEVADCLGHQIPFCIYVEGTHRPKRGLQPVKRGVFRIAQRAQEVVKKPVAIVPVGLAYESFFNLMTDVCIRFGEPFYLENYDKIELPEVLGERILQLISDYPTRKRLPLWLSIPLALLSVPLWLVSGAMCCPILLVSWLLGRRLEDRAWINTMRLCAKLVILPFIVIPIGILAFMHFPWWLAVLVVLAFAYAHSLFYLLLNLYENVINDIKELKK